jgi:hypothetical protein
MPDEPQQLDYYHQRSKAPSWQRRVSSVLIVFNLVVIALALLVAARWLLAKAAS